MRPLLLSIFALTALTSAFSDTSPYFLISSSSSIPPSARIHNILSTTSFISIASAEIKKCESDAYILVSQPGLHIEDLTATKHAGVHIKDLLTSVDADRRLIAENVFVTGGNEGDMGAVVEKLQGVAERVCNARVKGVDAKTGSLEMVMDEGKKPKVIRVDFDALSGDKEERKKMVEVHDAFLHSVLEMVGAGRYTFVFASSPIGAVEVKKVVVKKPQLELRSVEVREDVGVKNQTTIGGGLFHRYQFFTPGIFMGYLAFFLLISILYVGLSAVSSIQVSYGSFDKEMGPAVQKKQQ
ncbi:vacuolar ATP synthase subunit S1-domain-containing protein [Trichophaea hybrida]|nr:vacuolar ATP synthase subunit S1-domain-containing protein [Trichophaea hybrida]